MENMMTSSQTRIASSFSDRGIRGFYQSQQSEKVELPKEWKEEGNTKIIYKEVLFILAHSLQQERVCYFERICGSGKKIQFYVLTKAYEGEIPWCTGATVQEAAFECLNRLAFQVEEYAGETISCCMSYKKVLSSM